MTCIKKGIRVQVQQYYCKLCRKYQCNQYQRKQVTKTGIEMIGVLNNEVVGINSMARVLKLSPGTIINYLRKISESICFSLPDESGQEYEVDEIAPLLGRILLNMESGLYVKKNPADCRNGQPKCSRKPLS